MTYLSTTPRISVAILLLLVAAPLQVHAQQRAVAPFQVGRTYHLEYLGAAGDIRIVAPPDANGMARAVILGGFGSSSNTGQEVWMNVRLAILVQERPTATAPAAAPDAALSPAATAYLAAMRSDLRNLVTAQESYFADNVRYSVTVQGLGYNSTTGVSVSITTASGAGWAGTATHRQLPGYVCGIFVGNAPSPVPGAREGEPACVQR